MRPLRLEACTRAAGALPTPSDLSADRVGKIALSRDQAVLLRQAILPTVRRRY
jgi:hypothetical protein